MPKYRAIGEVFHNNYLFLAISSNGALTEVQNVGQNVMAGVECSILWLHLLYVLQFLYDVVRK